MWMSPAVHSRGWQGSFEDEDDDEDDCPGRCSRSLSLVSARSRSLTKGVVNFLRMN